MDFNGDGITDILSGCYWSSDDDVPNSNPQAGYFYLLAGKGDQDFEEATPVMTANGKPLTNIQLTQHQLDNYDSDNIEWGNLCTSQHAVDYDGDGDLDLVTGCMSNMFYIHTSAADDAKAAPKFSTPAKQLPIDSPDQHSDPHLFDWDGDGDLDLLTGGASGGVFISMNDGTAAKPQWSEFKQLVRGDQRHTQSTDGGSEILMGHGTRVWATDFNQDGKPDLLVGDSTTIENKVAGLSDEEFKRKKAAHAKLSQPINKKLQAIQEKYMKRIKQATEQADTEAVKKLSEEMGDQSQPIYEEYSQLYQQESKFVEKTRTGHVWVYLQQ